VQNGHGNEHTLCLPDAQLRCSLAQKVVARVIVNARQADAFQRRLDSLVAVRTRSALVAMRAPRFPELRANLERGVE
jgi:hypothetical protein